MSKPYLCNTCGETDPLKFYNRYKSRCVECCLVKRRKEYIPKIRTPELNQSSYGKDQKYFIDLLIANHGDIYLLDRVVYRGSAEDVELGCKKHLNYFSVKAATLMRRTIRNGGKEKNPDVGSCPICRIEYFAGIKDYIISKCRQAHNNEYEYGEHVNMDTPLKVNCKIHGWFEVMPRAHSGGGGKCPECYPIYPWGNKPNPKIKHIGEQKYYVCDIHGDVPIGKSRRGTEGCPRCKTINNKKNLEAIFRKAINKKYGKLNNIFITETYIEFRCKIHETQYRFLREKKEWKSKKFICDECRKESEVERLRIVREKSIKNVIGRIKKKLNDYNGDYEFIGLMFDDNNIDKWKVRVKVNLNHSERILSVNGILRNKLTTDHRKLPKKYLNYEDAKKKIFNLGITCFRQYQKWYQRVSQNDLPANIYRYYSDNGGWVSYNDFFGTDVDELMSAGEKRIAEYLKRKNIDFEYQKRYLDCKDKNTLPFDFYLPEYNLIIEFDGYQHFYPVKKFGSLEYIQKHDKIKNKYCADNSISILRIPYWELEDNVVEWTLDNELSKVGAERAVSWIQKNFSENF